MPEARSPRCPGLSGIGRALSRRRRPHVRERRSVRRSRDPARTPGLDKRHQVLQLLLQAPLVPVVLKDPVEGPKVIQATL